MVDQISNNNFANYIMETAKDSSTTDAGKVTQSDKTGNDFYKLLQQNKEKVRMAESDENNAEKAKEKNKMTRAMMLEYLKKKSKEMKEKIQHGDTKEKVMIGSSEFSSEEWDKLVEKIDKIVDDIKEQTQEMEEDQKESLKKQEILKKQTIKNQELQEQAVMSLINAL